MEAYYILFIEDAIQIAGNECGIDCMMRKVAEIYNISRLNMNLTCSEYIVING